MGIAARTVFLGIRKVVAELYWQAPGARIVVLSLLPLQQERWAGGACRSKKGGAPVQRASNSVVGCCLACLGQEVGMGAASGEGCSPNPVLQTAAAAKRPSQLHTLPVSLLPA